MNPRFQLDIFEGPLDLLLHLIKKNEVDVHDIPIALITDQYLAYLGLFEQLNLDLAGEYLVMAATLMQIKSRLLLPPAEGEAEEEEDPRSELVQQLEEYQRFRAAAAQLADRDILDRDVFRRSPEEPESETRELPRLRELELADLVDALREVLSRLPEDKVHEIIGERIPIADRIPVILERLRDGDVEFESLFEHSSRRELIATFLALLELVKMRAVRALQSERFGPILLTLAVPRDAEVSLDFKDEYKG
jgi:segregation and condensation protein A